MSEKAEAARELGPHELGFLNDERALLRRSLSRLEDLDTKVGIAIARLTWLCEMADVGTDELHGRITEQLRINALMAARRESQEVRDDT